jgi:hypothetical protein
VRGKVPLGGFRGKEAREVSKRNSPFKGVRGMLLNRAKGFVID